MHNGDDHDHDIEYDNDHEIDYDYDHDLDYIDDEYDCNEYHYHDYGHDEEIDDNCHLTALLDLVFIEVGVKIIPQSPCPGSNGLESSSPSSPKAS